MARQLPTVTLHAIVYPDTETREYLAHCLELDLMASGPTADDASRDLVDVVTAQIQFALDNDNVEHLLHPAPADAWQRFAGMLKAGFETVTAPIRIEDGEHRHFESKLDLALAS